MAADGEHRFRSTLRHTYRPTIGFSRHGDDHGFNFEVGFSAEGATDVGNDDFDFRVGIAEHVGKLGTHEEWVSRRSPERDTFAGYSRHRRVRFHRIVIDHRELIGFVDDLIGFGEAFRRIPLLEMLMMAYVGFLLFSYSGHLMKFTNSCDVLVE